MKKELLIKDLYARLPYEVKAQKIYVLCPDMFGCDRPYVVHEDDIERLKRNEVEIKPFLRPISSMTEEECKQLLSVRLSAKYGKDCPYDIKNFLKIVKISPCIEGSISVEFSFEKEITQEHNNEQLFGHTEYLGLLSNIISHDEIDWLIARHFDYRGLIPKGLAIAVTEQNNPYKA